MTRRPDPTEPGIPAALARIAKLPTQDDWSAMCRKKITQGDTEMREPIDLPDDHDPRFLKVRTGGNLHLSWWQRQAPEYRALLVMVAAVCAAGLALIVWLVWS